MGSGSAQNDEKSLADNRGFQLVGKQPLVRSNIKSTYACNVNDTHATMVKHLLLREMSYMRVNSESLNIIQNL